jgi:hypothetical protein
MAATLLALQTTSRLGLEPVYVSAEVAGVGNYFDNSVAEVILHVKNADTGSHTVTIVTPGTVDGKAIGDLEVAVPASEERMIGPFPKAIYNDADDHVTFDTEDETGITIAAIKIGPLSY